MASALPRRAGVLPRRLSALLLVLGAALALLLGSARPAAAHAALASTDPADGAVVETAPEQVTLTFTEAVRIADDAVQVLDPDAQDVTSGAAEHAGGDGGTVRVPLHSGLPNGTYVVAWKAVSADSHPVRGAFSFSVGAPSQTRVVVDQLSASGDTAAKKPYDLARYFAYAGLALLVGAAAFVLVCWPGGADRRPVQRLLLTGWAALLVSTLALLALRGPYEDRGGGGLDAALDLSVLQDTLDTKPGAALAVRLLLLAGVGAFLAVLAGQGGRDTPREVRFGLYAAGVLLAAGLASTWSVMEHASTGLQTGVAVPVDVLHLMAMGVWTGGLVTLLVALYAPGGRPVPTAAVERYSTLALTAVVVLVCTGVYQSWRQLGSWDALFSTDFGKLLLAKLAGVAVMLGSAFWSRRWARGLRAGIRQAPAATAAASGAAASGTGGASGTAAGGTAAAAGDEAAGNGRAAGTGAEKDAPDTAAGRGAAGTGAAGAGASGEGTSGTGSKGSAGAPGKGAKGGRSGNPARAAELARQRAAMAAARAKQERDADPGRGLLRRSVLVEVCVAVAVLAVTTFLTTTEPGRTAEAAGKGPAATQPAGPVAVEIPYDTGGPGGKGTVELDIDPARTGENELHVILTDPSGEPVDAPELRVSFTQKAKDIGPLQVGLQQLTEGHWVASGVQLPLPGTWEVSVTVRTSDIDQVTEKKNVTIG